MLSSPKIVLLVLTIASSLALGACGEDEFEFQQSLSFNGLMNLDTAGFRAEAGDPAPFDEVAPVVLPVDFKMSELSPELIDYKERGLFRTMNFNSVRYTIIENTTTTDIEPMEVYLAPLGSTEINPDEGVLIATIPAISAGTTPTGEAEILHANTSAASTLVFDLDFATVTGAEISLRAGDETPTGKMRLQVDMVMTIKADPL